MEKVLSLKTDEEFGREIGRKIMGNGDEDITWITVNGRHIPIKEGQSVENAIKGMGIKGGKSEKGIVTISPKEVKKGDKVRIGGGWMKVKDFDYDRDTGKKVGIWVAGYGEAVPFSKKDVDVKR